MKKFKNNLTGVIYTVTNKNLIEQYENRKDIYTEVKSNTKEVTLTVDKKTNKKTEKKLF